MAVGSLDSENVNLVPGNLTMSQPVDMPIFRLNEWKFSCCHQVFRSVIENKVSDSNKKGLSMVVVMKRKLTSEMMTTYFPTILLTAITFATTFFKPFFFEAALSVNLTTMLVMTTIFISKMEGLPPTSDIKMIDIWLVLCQMVPFAEVVLLTATEYHRKDQDEKDVEIPEVFPKVSAATQTRLSIRFIGHGTINSTFDSQSINIKHETNDKGEMDISIESQWRKKSWFPSLKTLGLLADLYTNLL